jgi:hypothetical protein
MKKKKLIFSNTKYREKNGFCILEEKDGDELWIKKLENGKYMKYLQQMN